MGLRAGRGGGGGGSYLEPPVSGMLGDKGFRV